MNNPKVLSIFNNAKIFLSPEELKELALCIDKEVGRPEPRKIKKSKPLANWTIESVTENLLATQFKSRRRS
jgi:hypothetical protein